MTEKDLLKEREEFRKVFEEVLLMDIPLEDLHEQVFNTLFSWHKSEEVKLLECLKECIRLNVTKYIALSLERHLSEHGITQCTIKLDIDACMENIIQQAISRIEKGE